MYQKCVCMPMFGSVATGKPGEISATADLVFCLLEDPYTSFFYTIIKGCHPHPTFYLVFHSLKTSVYLVFYSLSEGPYTSFFGFLRNAISYHAFFLVFLSSHLSDFGLRIPRGFFYDTQGCHGHFISPVFGQILKFTARFGMFQPGSPILRHFPQFTDDFVFFAVFRGLCLVFPAC